MRCSGWTVEVHLCNTIYALSVMRPNLPLDALIVGTHLYSVRHAQLRSMLIYRYIKLRCVVVSFL